MKHIFKKLHHPNRSNETPQPPPSSGSRPTSSSSPSTTSPGAAATSNASDDTTNRQQQQEYFASEEEYQVQLALALSVSSSGQGSSLLDLDKNPIRPNVAAEENSNLSFDILSRRYWNYGVLDFEERVVDGFYDIYNISADPKVRGNMPSLRDIECDNEVSDYEVVIVNRNIDPALQELMQIAHTIVLDYPTTNTPLLIQKLAELVTDHLGGPVRDANLMLVKWMERSTELRTSLHTSVLPIGSLRTGLSRHRALLFKVLADSVGIPCRLVRGNHYTGIEDDAVNIIKLQNDSECLVDLMGAPGTLIPADALGAQDKSSDPKPNKLPSIQITKDPKISTDNTNDGVGTSGQNDTVPSANQLDQNLPQAIGSSICVRKNLNVVPYNQKRAEDPKNLFADLNPFQVKGPVKTLPPNNLSNEVDKFQFPKVNNLSNRPPVPLMWKNREAWNAVSWKNGSDIVDGAYVKDNKGTASKLPENSFNNQGDKGERPPLGKNYKLPTGEDVSSKLSADKDFSISNKDRDSTIDSKLNMQERVCTDMKLRVTEGASCSRESGASYVNAVIDDVGEREILWEDLIIGERIGLGSYGEVYRADWNGTEVAVKKFLDQDFSGAALDEFKREVRIMRRLRHQNVVLFMGAVTRPPNLSIVTEFLPLGSLYRIIHHPQCQLDEQRRIKMALDVAKGMNCLHTSIPTIVHRDLKTPNLLVDDNWNVKVGDFGLSRLKHNTFLSSKSTAGTPEWMAPEVLRNEPSNEKCDVYSFGVILWELATLRKPWSDMNPMQVVGAVGFQNRHLEIPREVDPLVATIIKQCWQMDPNLRPSFAQLIVALKPLQRLVIPVV